MVNKFIIILLIIFRGVDMAEYLVSDPAIQDTHPHTQYDLIANICHEGEPGKGNIKRHLRLNLLALYYHTLFKEPLKYFKLHIHMF